MEDCAGVDVRAVPDAVLVFGGDNHDYRRGCLGAEPDDPGDDDDCGGHRAQGPDYGTRDYRTGCQFLRGTVHRAELGRFFGRGGQDHPRRSVADVCQYPEFCLLRGHFQAAYPEIQRYYLHEVDVRLFHRVCPAVRTRPAADGFPVNDPGHRVAGALRRGVRDLHLLFPHTHRAETPEAHVSVHVLLRAAGGGYVRQPCRRHGYDDVGQGSGGGAGLPRGGDCQFLPAQAQYFYNKVLIGTPAFRYGNSIKN